MAKKLLEENTVRRFMKIAGLQPLSEGFVDNLEEEVVEEEAVEEGYKEGEMGMDPAKEEMKEEEDMEGGDEKDLVDDEEPAAEEPAGDVDSKVADALTTIVDVLTQLGVEGLSVESDDDDMEVQLDDEPEMPEPDMADKMEEEVEVTEEVSDEAQPLEEGEHMEEPAKDPAGHSLENPELVDYADSKDPNQDPQEKEEDEMKEGPDMANESIEKLKKQLIEQVTKKVAERISKLK